MSTEQHTTNEENPLAVFIYHQKEVRTVLDEAGEPWFVAKDVCDILDLKDPSTATARLDEDEKGPQKVLTLGGTQELLTISESGLYTLVIRSNKPEAKPFRRWVTKEVLPSIRKTGSYRMPGVESARAHEEHRKNVRNLLSLVRALASTKEKPLRTLLWEMIRDSASRMGYPLQGELLEGT